MSAIIRARRQKNLPLSTLVLWAVLGMAAAFFLFTYGHELILAHSLNEQAAAQRVTNIQARDENARLEALLKYYQSDKYIEQRAREDLNLRRPDETVLIPVDAAGGSTAPAGGPVRPADGAQAGAAPIEPVPEANWQKWLDLFRPSP